jgi:hypothetical protein
MKSKVYLETTIPSYLAGRSSRDLLVAAHQQNMFGVYVSELVLQEIRSGNPAVAAQRSELLRDLAVLPMNEDALLLAADMIASGTIPKKATADAAHIALATVYGCDYPLTWNCRHIANAELHKSLQRIVGRHGYEFPVLCTPKN